MLDGADGLDWEAFCHCSVIYSVRSADLKAKRGEVSRPRRGQMRAKLKAMFQLDAADGFRTPGRVAPRRGPSRSRIARC